MAESKRIGLGGLWLEGEAMCGRIGVAKCEIVKNHDKQSDSQPDYKLYAFQGVGEGSELPESEMPRVFLGGLWIREYKDKDGNDRKKFAGTFGTSGKNSKYVRMLEVYKNDRKQEDRHPDYNMSLLEFKKDENRT